jgi:hypothetical protein
VARRSTRSSWGMPVRARATGQSSGSAVSGLSKTSVSCSAAGRRGVSGQYIRGRVGSRVAIPVLPTGGTRDLHGHRTGDGNGWIGGEHSDRRCAGGYARSESREQHGNRYTRLRRESVKPTSR